jgi:hypothetical protein
MKPGPQAVQVRSLVTPSPSAADLCDP